MSTPSIPGVNRDVLLQEVCGAFTKKHRPEQCKAVNDAVFNYIAAHHECVCNREHDDEWVEVLLIPPLRAARLRKEWTEGYSDTTTRLFVHRDDLPDETVDKRVEVAAQWLAEYIGENECGTADAWRNEAKSLLEALNEIGEAGHE